MSKRKRQLAKIASAEKKRAAQILRAKSKRHKAEVISVGAATIRKLRKATPKLAIEDAFNGKPTPGLSGLIHNAMLGCLDDQVKEKFRELLDICSRTRMMDADRKAISGLWHQAKNNFPSGLFRLAYKYEKWIRQPEDWKSKSKNPNRAFRGLARHLLCKYDVPTFLDAAWFEERRAAIYQEWFEEIGSGMSIRKLRNMPIDLTKKMAHHFTKAPQSLTIKEAIRWAQVYGLGGNGRCVKGIIETRLGNDFVDNEFWESVVRFFIAHPFLDTRHYGPITDYIHNQKFVSPGVEYVDDKAVRLPPDQPNFCMRQRTPDTLLKRVEEWHTGLGKRKVPHAASWDSCGIDGITISEGREGNRKVYVIIELITDWELTKEGRAMRHCVGSYSHSCGTHASAIYSLRKDTNKGEGLLTISLRPKTRSITEARKKFNARPTDQDIRFLRLWCNHRNLTMSRWVK